MANSKRTKTKVAPVQQQGITPQNMAMIQQMQDMQAAENQQKILTQEADNKQHDPDSEQTPDPQMIVITDKDVKRAMGILQKYKECKANLEKRIIENEEWFKMQHWPMIQKEQKKDDIRPASAWLFNSIINKHADIMDNFPEALILPREQSDEATAKTLSSVIPVILQQNDYEQVYSDIGWYKLKTGSSAQSICWDNTKLNGLGDISIKKCDIINLFWQSGITDIQDSANVFYVTLVDNDELKKNYPNLKSLGNYPELDVNKYIYDDQVDTTEKSAVVDWYYKQHVSGYDKDGIPQTKTILQYCKFCNGQVLFASENDPQMREEGFYKHVMMSDGWIDVTKYKNPEQIYEGEIGKIAGIRFVESSNAKVWRGTENNCPDGLSVYGIVVVGRGAYGTTSVEGGGLQTIVKQLGSGEDPLNQRATVGWKAVKVSERLVEQYMVRIECCSDESENERAN